jgi:mRNA deadenylase 3'-5' endonuclease subunit Ccr4
MEVSDDWKERVDTGELVWIDTIDPDTNGASRSDPKALLKVVSYNILAEAYAREDWFPRTPLRHLLYSSRAPRILARLASSGADIICLQVRNQKFSLTSFNTKLN